jgi:hypothetical protein
VITKAKIQEAVGEPLWKPAATEADIVAAERQLKLRFPPELRELLLVSDGLREVRGNTELLYSVKHSDHDCELARLNLGQRDVFAEHHPHFDVSHLLWFGNSPGGTELFIECFAPFRILEHEPSWGNEFQPLGTGILRLFRELCVGLPAQHPPNQVL